MNDILLPAAFVAAGGGVLGLILGLVAQFMQVPVDPLAENIRSVLPGANCGACGYPGCDGYAEHLADKSETNITLCTPGGAQVVTDLSELLGVSSVNVVPLISLLHCNGTCDNTTAAVDYAGPPSCAAANSYYGGKGECSWGCIGFGDCVPVCAFDAIYMNNGVPVIDPFRCTGCNMCADACPHGLFTMVPRTQEVHVVCSSHDRGNISRKACQVSCTGCSRCVRECQQDAITMDNLLAIIDPEKCTNCGDCVLVCPTKCIHQFQVPVAVEA